MLKEGTKRTCEIPREAMQGCTEADRQGEQAPEPIAAASKAHEFERGDTVTFEGRDG